MWLSRIIIKNFRNVPQAQERANVFGDVQKRGPESPGNGWTGSLTWGFYREGFPGFRNLSADAVTLCTCSGPFPLQL